MSALVKHGLQQFLTNIVNAKHHELLDMLTDDAVMDFPYHLPTTPTRLVGKSEIAKFFSSFSDFVILDEARLTHLHETANPNVGILEYEGESKAIGTGLPYTQQHITVLTFRDGKICHWKDYWNPVNVINATGGSVNT